MNFNSNLINRIKRSEYLIHETKKHTLKRFFIVLFIFIAYLFFICWKYGIKGGVEVGLLTWAFFVFCTPIADAGFLVGFPTRLFAGIRMIYSEIIVTFVGFFITAYFLFFNSSVFDKDSLLKIYKEILIHPNPFWLIIIISTIGTFLSIYFGDELIDVARHDERKKFKKHKKKYLFVLSLFFLVFTILLYKQLLQALNISF